MTQVDLVLQSKEKKNKMHVIARKNIINQNEYLADTSGRVFEFKNATSARDFLRDNGIKKPEREGIELIQKPALEEIKAYELNPSWQL